MTKTYYLILFAVTFLHCQISSAEEVLKLWPGKPPGDLSIKAPETDITKETDRLVGGHRIIKLANVSSPEIHVFLPAEENRNGSAIVICPGGGFNILAWDLEGIEVAKWLNKLGITGIVVKYRTPTRSQSQNWLIPVQDTQRAISLTRHHCEEWKLNPKRIGVLGFSAGGMTAALTATSKQRRYDAIDNIDKHSCKPNLAALIYPAYLVNKKETALKEIVQVDSQTPPMFLVHAFDDPVTVQSSLKMMSALKQANVPSELHIYAAGGHGYGLRPVKTKQVTTWPSRCEDWLRNIQWTKK